MKHLSDEALETLRTLIPADCYFVLIVASQDGTGVDTNVQSDKVVPFLEETARNMEWECERTLKGKAHQVWTCFACRECRHFCRCLTSPNPPLAWTGNVSASSGLKLSSSSEHFWCLELDGAIIRQRRCGGATKDRWPSTEWKCAWSGFVGDTPTPASRRSTRCFQTGSLTRHQAGSATLVSIHRTAAIS